MTGKNSHQPKPRGTRLNVPSRSSTCPVSEFSSKGSSTPPSFLQCSRVNSCLCCDIKV